jgi:integrase/recombinase XerD
MQESWLREFQSDWCLSGKSIKTATEYCRYIYHLHNCYKDPSLTDVKEWLQKAPGASLRRKKAMAVRALGKWCEDAGIDYFEWWKQVPLVTEQVLPQPTVTEDVYRQVLARCKTPRDKALIEVLWSSGLRRSEIERMKIEHLDFVSGFIVVPTSKANRPRVVPMSPTAMRALRRLIGSRTDGSVFGMTGNAIRLSLTRIGAPSAHAWRRGWAVHALRRGVSEASVKAAAGWRSGAMVSRYTNALSGELAISEFRNAW